MQQFHGACGHWSIQCAGLHVLLLAALFALVAAGCGSSEPASELPPTEIVQRSADVMSGVERMRFRLEVLNGTMVIGQNLAATSVNGDVVAPDRLRLQVKARFATTPVELQVVAADGKQFITNPLTQQWQDVSGTLVLPPLLDANRGIGPALRDVQDPRRLGRDRLDGVETYRLRGMIPAETLTRLVGAQSAAAEPVTIDLWIDTESFVLRRIKLIGAIVAGEEQTLERQLRFSDFDAPITIDAPAL